MSVHAISLTLDELQHRHTAAQIRYMAAGEFAHRVCDVAHRTVTLREVDDARTALSGILRTVRDDSGLNLPIHEVAAQMAAIECRRTRKSVHSLADNFLLSPDIVATMGDKPALRRAIIHAAQHRMQPEPAGFSFDPIFRDAGRLEFPTTGVADIEKQRLGAQVDLLRTAYHLLCRILTEVRGRVREADAGLPLLESIIATRRKLSHVGYINGDGREYALSGPLVLAALYNHHCRVARLHTEPEPQCRDVLREYVCEQSGEMMLHAQGDEALAPGFDAAKIIAQLGVDYTRNRRQSETQRYQPDRT